MKSGLSAAYSVFVLALTTVIVVSLLYVTVTSISSPTNLEWLTVIGFIIVIYLVGIAISFAGLYVIEKLFKRDKKRAKAAVA
jgi:predicted permease